MHALTILLKKDGRVIRNLFRLARAQSRFKTVFISTFALALIFGLWVMFRDGFRFISVLGGVGVMLIHHLFSLFFFGLGAMLIISNIIAAYTAIYQSAEASFLLLRPITRGSIILHQMLESALLSSWAFFFVIIPFVGAFAWQEKLPAWFAVWTLLFSIPFVILCAEIGTIVTVLAVRWVPRFRPGVWVAGGLSAAIILGIIYFQPGLRQETNDAEFIMARLVPGLQMAAWPLWPSQWVAEGIMALARENWMRGLAFFGVLTANVLFAGLLVELTGDTCFYASLQKTLMAWRRRPRRLKSSPLFGRLLAFLAPDARALVLKDLRLLLRDPLQWTQGLIFFGLLGLYFINLRNLHYHTLMPVWRNLIAFINIFSLSAIMCSFCARFVFPQLSLEGHSFWLVGLSPTKMGRVLLLKFGLAVVGLLAISLTLILISATMLHLERGVRLTTFLITAAMAVGLSGLSTGLGAVFMEVKQRNPMAVISGFGGTLNLALSLVFMTAIIFPFGFLFHAYYLGNIADAQLRAGLALATLWLMALTPATAIVPLLLGRRSLNSREY